MDNATSSKFDDSSNEDFKNNKASDYGSSYEVSLFDVFKETKLVHAPQRVIDNEKF